MTNYLTNKILTSDTVYTIDYETDRIVEYSKHMSFILRTELDTGVIFAIAYDDIDTLEYCTDDENEISGEDVDFYDFSWHKIEREQEKLGDMTLSWKRFGRTRNIRIY